jgi:hypothetical protein
MRRIIWTYGENKEDLFNLWCKRRTIFRAFMPYIREDRRTDAQQSDQKALDSAKIFGVNANIGANFEWFRFWASMAVRPDEE